MFKIPEASRGLVKSFAQACLNLRHYQVDNILVHLSQRLLSPEVICDFSLSQLGIPTSLVPFFSGNQEKIFQKSDVYYYRKRGRPSYIVREVLSVREREIQRERERKTEVTSKLSR